MRRPPKERRRPGRGSAGDQNRQGLNQGGHYGENTALSTAAILPFANLSAPMRDLRMAHGRRA